MVDEEKEENKMNTGESILQSVNPKMFPTNRKNEIQDIHL